MLTEPIAVLVHAEPLPQIEQRIRAQTLEAESSETPYLRVMIRTGFPESGHPP